MIKSVNSEGSIRKLRDSGRFDFGVDADKDESERTQEVRDTVSNVVRDIFAMNSPEDEGDD